MLLLAGLDAPFHRVAHAPGCLPQKVQGFTALIRGVVVVKLLYARRVGHGAVHTETAADHKSNTLGVHLERAAVIVPVHASVMEAGKADLGGEGGEYLPGAVLGIDLQNTFPLIVAHGHIQPRVLNKAHGCGLQQCGKGRVHPVAALDQRFGLSHRPAGGLAHIVVAAHKVAPEILIAGRDENRGPLAHFLVHHIPALLVPEVGGADFGGVYHLRQGQGDVPGAQADVVRLQHQKAGVQVGVCGNRHQRPVPHLGQLLPCGLVVLGALLLALSGGFEDFT